MVAMSILTVLYLVVSRGKVLQILLLEYATWLSADLVVAQEREWLSSEKLLILRPSQMILLVKCLD